LDKWDDGDEDVAEKLGEENGGKKRNPTCLMNLMVFLQQHPLPSSLNHQHYHHRPPNTSHQKHNTIFL